MCLAWSVYSKRYPDFTTVTCLDWKPVLVENAYKDIIIDSLRFLVSADRVSVYGFVIMANHFHLLWQMMGDHALEEVQRDFLKYTAQRILQRLRNAGSPLLNELVVNLEDRKHQVWKRNSLSIPLWTPKVLIQKLNYMHQNPVRAGICAFPEEYKYSSAGFYELGKRDWDFLVHIGG